MADQSTNKQPTAPQTNRDQHPNMYYLPSEWVEYGPKQVPGTPNPLQEKVNKILSPGGLVSPRMGQPVRISESFINNPVAAQVRYNNQAQLIKLPQPGPDGEQYVIMGSDKQATYWENPQRVARYNDMIRTAPPGWQPPEWMDTKAIGEAYQYLKYVNKGKPWTDWLAISDEDPAKDFFKSIPPPPAEALWPSEKKFAEQYLPYSDDQIKQQQLANWNELPRWQQWWETLAMPQSQLEGRPEISRLAASAVQGGIAGLGALGISSMVGGGIGLMIGGPAGALAGAGVGATVGKVLGSIVAGASIYQSYSGNEIPAMSSALNAFDALAIGLKRGIGVMSQDRSQVFKDWGSLRAAWQAGEATYAVSDIDAINAFARILDFIDFNSNYFEVNPNKLAQDNQVWKISQGYTEPVDISDPRNAEALNWLREEILKKDFDTNKEVMDFVNEFKTRYGDTAIAADLVYETILDPANFIGFSSGKLGKGYAKLTGNEGLAHAFDVTTGNPIIDVLPFGVQQLAEAVTGVEGSKGPLAALDYYKNMIRQGTYPASMWDMPEDMRSQYNKLIKKGYKPEDIQVSGKVLTWNENGVQKIFEGSRDANPPVPSIEELSKFEKDMAGVDETYGLKELRPTQNMNWFQRLTHLTPASQAHLMLNLFHSQMATLMNMAGGDVNTMVKLWKQAAGVSPIAAGDIGEAILKSPVMRSIQEAIRSGVIDNDMLDNMMVQWISGEKPRLLLQKISKALKQTPAETIDQLKTNPDNLIARINDIAPQVGDAKFLKDTLGVFTGDDHLPWNEREFQAQIMVTMADKMDKYLTDHFGLKPDPALMRVSKALKGVQSLVLLGLNPAYFLNNYVNNVVTRAAVGVMGYMTPRQINEFLDRFGITPSRIDTGVSPMGEALYGGRAGIAKAMDAGDAISKATKVIQATNNKLGIFSRLSVNMERMESRQSTVIAMKRFLGKSWKRGKGFRKLHPLTEATLDRVAPGMKEVLYQAVEAGLNMDEVEGAIFGEYIKPQIDGIADQVDKTLFPNTPGLGKQMLVETGILDELKKKIANVQDAADIDIAFDDMINELEKHIDQKTAQDIIDRAETVANIVQNERIPAVLSLYGDMEIMIAQHWIDGRRRLDDLFAKRSEPGTNYDAWQAEYRAEEMRQSIEWERVYDLETQTYAGIVKALGVESDYSKAFIEQLDIIHKSWKEFNDLRRKQLDKFFDGYGRKDKETYEQYQNRRDLEWNILQDELDDLYQKHYDIERKAQMEMDRMFAEGYKKWANWKVDKAISWREKIRDIRFKMYQAQRQQRALTRNMNTAEKDASYVDFNPLYNRMIADMKQLEQDGAFELMNEPKPAKTVEDLVGEEAFKPREPGAQLPAENPPVSEAPVNVESERNVHQSIYDLANEYGIPTATKDGKPMDTVMRNVINTYLKNHDQPVLKKGTDINSLDSETIINAFEEHKKRHEIEKVKKDIVSTIKAQDIIDLADKQVREAKLKQAGYLNRMEIEEKFRSIPNITELEVKAVMLLLDHRADRWARQNGSEPSDATRDAWYATRIKDVLSGEREGERPSLEQQLTGMNDIERRDFLFNMNPIQVDTTSLGTTRESIRNGAKEAYAKITNTAVVNVNDGREIKFRKNAIKKILGHIGANIYDAQVVVELPNIISNGIVLFSSRNNVPGDNATYHHYGTRVLIDGKEAFVRVIVREENGNLFYDSHVTLGEKIKETLSWTSSVPQRQRNQENASKDILVNWLAKVKSQENGETTDLSQNKRGSVSFLKDGRAVIHALNASDISTMVHEIGHIFRRDLNDAQMEVVAKLGGLKDAAEFKDLETKFWNKTATEEEAARYSQVEEMFADGWERYLAEGYAPTPALRSLFKQFTDWMLNIYKELRKVAGRVTGFEKSQIGVDIRATVDGVSLRDIFDDLLVDRPDRPKDYHQLLTRKMEDIKTTGRNWRLDDIALQKRADKELISNLLGRFVDLEEATKAAESDNLITLADGTQVEPEVIYDAITRVDADPSLNPWVKEKKQIPGTTTTARGISNPNNKYDFQFKVMELDDVQASNVWVGDRLELNPDYPQELQPRERTEAQSVTQVDTIARSLVPEELIYDARALDRGAPIIGSDNAVESGNGRILAIKRAAEMYPEQYKEYKAALKESAGSLGIDPGEIEKMDKPVLVRERLTDTDRIAFVNDANKPIALQMNAMEVAINDTRLITDESLMNLEVGDNETIESAIQSHRNTWFVNRFLDKLSKNEAAELSNNGIINQQGVQRIINAVFAKVYPGAAGERLLRAFSMSMSSNIKAAESAIMASLPQIARVEGMIASGARNADLSVTGDISMAVDKLAALRSGNMSVSDYLGQMSFLGDELTPTQKVLLKFISEQRQPKRIREFLREYANLVEKEPDPNQMSMFGDMSRTKEDLLNDAIRRIEPEAEGLFAAAEPTGEQAKAVEATPAVQVDQLAPSEQGGPGVREDDAGRVEERGRGTEKRTGIGQAEVTLQVRFDEGSAIPIDQVENINLKHSDIEFKTSTQVPQDGIYVVKLHLFKHGDHDIVAAVYKDGEMVALLPDNYDTNTFQVDESDARVLGVSPENPEVKIYEVDGEIKRSDGLPVEPLRQSENLIQISEDDVPYKVAYDAYRGISFVPEVRAKSVQKEYVEHLTAVQNELLHYADTPEKLSILRDGLDQYKKGYLKYLFAYLNAKSRVVSSNIAGPSNFPAKRMEARSETEAKRLNELIDWSKKAQTRLKKSIAPDTSRVVSSDNPEAMSILQSKVEKAEKFQNLMIEANKIVRKKGLNDNEKIKRLVDLGIKENQAVRLLKPDFAGRLGFPDYSLKNNNAEIKRLKSRIEELSRNKETPSSEMEFDGGRVYDNADENRIQIFFDSKPDEATRGRLKARGFKWAPSQGAWQRQRTDNARAVIRELFPDIKPIEANQEVESTFIVPGIEMEVDEKNLGNLVNTPEPVLKTPRGDVVIKKRTAGDYDIFVHKSSVDNDLVYTVYRRKVIEDSSAKGTKSIYVPENYPEWVANIGNEMVNQARQESQNLSLFQKRKAQPGQFDIFAGSADDLPIFSGVPVSAREELFAPKKQGIQSSLFPDIVPEEKPRRIIEIEVKEDGAGGSYRIDMRNIKAIEKIAALNKGADIKFRIVDDTGKVLSKGTDLNNIISPSLFQSDINNPEGEVPLGGTPEPQPSGMPLHELNSSTIRPMLDRMKEEYKRSMHQQFKVNDLDPVSQREIKKWLGTVRSDMASTKLAAINYGEQFRDAALLNYTRRYGVDNILDMVYPYQFWYTRTMMNWARRMVDKPGWYAMYARLQRMQDELEKKGMPTRLRGKVRFPMPWLPEWTGRGLWSDPMKAIFPFDQFGQPLEQYASNKNQIEKRAESILDDMVQSETITYSQAQSALASKNDAVWKEAYKQAEIELDKSGNPINLAGMMMQPALWWTMPFNIAMGKPEKISPLPVTRTGQAIRTVGSGTIAEPVTDFIGGLLASPEEFVRKKAGLSEFGQWGDYYIDRTLANMAADGTIDANTAQIAMIQRSGPAFDEAKRRIAYEQALRTPGTGPLLALKEGANPGEVLSAIIQTIFPGGLFPEGELKQRNLYTEYNNAWRKLNTGDPDAINKFFEDHPEYEARLALYDEPDQRLRQFLISSVWDRWFAIDKPNRTKVVQAFGQDFEDFLNKETRDEENIDIQLLANWAQAMGALLPKTDELKELPEPTEIDFYDQEMVNNIQTYQNERDNLFPNYYALQNQYYALPAGTQRKAFLRQFPQLKQYWSWKDAYKKAHPELIEYFDELKEDNDAVMEDAINDMDPVMMNQLFYYSQGKQMSQGGIAEMQRLWKKYGKPKGMTLEEYISFMARAIYQ